MKIGLKKHISLYFIVLFVTLLFAGCIKNDIPYPYIQPNFLSITVTDESQPARIDSVNRIVNIYLLETADIKNVEITSYELTDGATIVGPEITGGIDLSEDVDVTLMLYQEYVWTLSANQDISRYFTVANQIGASEIDASTHSVTAYISDAADITAVEVLTMKLGSTNSTMSPDLTGTVVNFSEPVSVIVSDYGREETWTIVVETTESPVYTDRVDAWTNVAWVYGRAEVGKNNGVEYRLNGDTEWITVPDSWVTHDGGVFTARIIHLTPNTTYQARAYSDDDTGIVLDFTTGSEAQVPNNSFEDWWLNGKVWNPWAEDGTSFWDTGNKGVTTLLDSNSQPSEDTPSGIGGLSAELKSVFAGVFGIGKLGAGNIFTGSYVRTDGTNGVLSFGREFTERPTRLTGYMKYTTKDIDYTNSELTDFKGRPDTCSIYIALADWDEPYEIRTNPSDRQLFDPNDSHVIAYGALESGETIPEYIKFDIELDYRSTQRVPRYILIVASSSKYGDYFTGANGALLYVDDFVLEYDYDN